MIPLVHPIFGKEEKKIINEVIDSRVVASGKYVEQFEQQFAKLSNAKFGVACSNGTTALHAALLACGVKAGDKVITTPFTFIATANSILFCGAKPIFADIDPETYNICPKSVEKILKTQKVKAVVCVHLYGLASDMGALLKLKKKYKFALIEDACQAHLAGYNGKIVGAIGDASAFSFYATKNMTTGEGGIILTNDKNINSLSRQYINHGRSGHSTHTVLGYNYRLTNISAAMGIVQCKQIQKWTKQRIKNASKLSNGLKNLDFIQVPIVQKGYTHVFHQYTVRIKNGLRDSFMKYLQDNGIGCGVYYPEVIYKQPLYKNLGYKGILCQEAEQAVKEVLSLPVHPALSDKDIKFIINTIKDFKS
ncbi:MAG: DegT/DnrJ/EryC1/StrS family aminotransferase [Endomicrobiaceae bacterium]|nr:DegT/DnrJ/EryC1/StrS family aminotransferase [Endomicrobiaceae bacterium]